jgi:hypothetical protein
VRTYPPLAKERDTANRERIEGVTVHIRNRSTRETYHGTVGEISYKV